MLTTAHHPTRMGIDTIHVAIQNIETIAMRCIEIIGKEHLILESVPIGAQLISHFGRDYTIDPSISFQFVIPIFEQRIGDDECVLLHDVVKGIQLYPTLDSSIWQK